MSLPNAFSKGLVAVGLWMAATASTPVFAASPQPPASRPEAGGRAAATASFDPVAATDAYLAKLSPEQRARSDAYFEGGYWLQLWGFLYGAAVAILLLATRLSARMRDLAVRVTRFAGLQTALYWVAVPGGHDACSRSRSPSTRASHGSTSMASPRRRSARGSATRPRGWRSGAVLGGLALMAIYAVIRRAPRTWWLWGAGVSRASSW